MPNAMTSFALATLMPVPLLLLATLFGGWWALLALSYLALFTFMLDEWTSVIVPPVDGREFPTTDQLSIALAATHFLLLLVVMLGLTGVSGLGWFSSILLFLATGLYLGQVSNANAHELIHNSDRRLFKLGMWIYISMLIGHHTSAHRLVHHRYVATGDDPATADMDETFYDYAQRAWTGGFRAGYEMEQVMNQKLDGKKRTHPYLIYCAGAAGFAFGVTVLFGFGGLVAFVMLAAFAQTQLLLSDYVQHYGLQRRRLPGGTVEQVRAEHSWNAPHWFTGTMMLNAPRHSDHHTDPKKPFAELRLPVANSAPMLPCSLPAMCAIALYPPLFFAMMTPRAKAWRNAPRTEPEMAA